MYPIPIVLVGALVDGTPNFATIGDHHTTRGIREHRTYSINIPTTEMLAITDYRGIVSGREVDKSALFDIFYGDLPTAPLIAACPVNIECRVVEQVTIQHRQIFIADVIQTHISDQYAHSDGERTRIADMRQLDPIIYALDNRYYAIGDMIGTGYTEGKALQRGDGDSDADDA